MRLRNALLAVLLSTGLPLQAWAQSSSGNVSGEAAAGDVVTITVAETGFRRELRIEKDGKYQVRRVPTGGYQVAVVHKDGRMEPVQTVVVRPGGTARVMAPGHAAGDAARPES